VTQRQRGDLAKGHANVAAGQDGRIGYWNETAEQLFGYASADAVGQRVDLIVPDSTNPSTNANPSETGVEEDSCRILR
jgi:PAS domain S-box-containing protein